MKRKEIGNYVVLIIYNYICNIYFMFNNTIFSLLRSIIYTRKYHIHTKYSDIIHTRRKIYHPYAQVENISRGKKTQIRVFIQLFNILLPNIQTLFCLCISQYLSVISHFFCQI